MRRRPTFPWHRNWRPACRLPTVRTGRFRRNWSTSTRTTRKKRIPTGWIRSTRWRSSARSERSGHRHARASEPAVASGRYQVVAHESRGRMLRHVTVIQEQSGIVLEAQQNAHAITRHHQHRIQPARVDEAITDHAAVGAVEAFQHPELEIVHMHGMGHGYFLVGEFPDFGRVQLHDFLLCHRHHVETAAINRLLKTTPVNTGTSTIPGTIPNGTH